MPLGTRNENDALMKKRTRPVSPQAMKRSYPIVGLVENWYFRRKEISAGHFEVEGADRWGRTVSRSGTDPEQLLTECVEMAKEINARIADRQA